jgi:hypothetical protein
LEAVLVDRPDFRTSIVWVAEMLGRISGETGASEELVSRYEERLRLEAAEGERRHLASFQVIDLSTLPETEKHEGERYAEADWPVIARIAVGLLETGVSPRDQTAIITQGRVELSEQDCGLLWSLFYDPIAIPREGSLFINGRHRTASMRAAGAERAVVHTDRGYA